MYGDRGTFRKLVALCAAIGLAMPVLVVVGTSPVGADSFCNARIIKEAPSDDVMNVGQQAVFSAEVTGAGLSPNYQWGVSGDILKDYTDYSRTPNALDNYVNGFAPISMTPADLRHQSIQFYWEPDSTQISPLNGGPVARNITLSITGVPSCSSQMTVMVERNNTDPARDAEHWYTSNHPIGPCNSCSRVLDEHAVWHMGNQNGVVANTLSQPGYGHKFFEFHHLFIATFNAWRERFGYPDVVHYDAATPLPTGVEVDHAARGLAGGSTPDCTPLLPTCATPSEFTPTGTVMHTPSMCDPASHSFEPTKIQEWPADQNYLGCAVTQPWHNKVHTAIGGMFDMSSISRAPMDPIFWRWHQFIDEVSILRSTFQGPPIVQSESPERYFPWITSLSSVEIRFDKPVRGVTAKALTVNKKPAKKVTGSGRGPYVFSGFPSPPLGTINVALVAGSTVSAKGKPYRALANSWTYKRLDPKARVTGDTLTVGQKIAMNLNPTVASQMGDGVSDGFKLAHSCTANLLFVHIDHPVDYAMNPLPPISNPDSSTIHDAFRRATDPCSDAAAGAARPGLVKETRRGASFAQPDSGPLGSLILVFFAAVAVVLGLSWHNPTRRRLRSHKPAPVHSHE